VQISNNDALFWGYFATFNRTGSSLKSSASRCWHQAEKTTGAVSWGLQNINDCLKSQCPCLLQKLSSVISRTIKDESHFLLREYHFSVFLAICLYLSLASFQTILDRIEAIAMESRGLSVCLSVGHVREPCKTTAPIEMPFTGGWFPRTQRNHVLDRVEIPHGNGQCWGCPDH